MVQAVIFDMDGLMFDSEAIWCASWQSAFAAHGLAVGPELALGCIGMTRQASLELVDRLFEGSVDARQAFFDHFDVARDVFVRSGAPKKPGLDELIEYLRGRGIPLAVASSSRGDVIDALLGHGKVVSHFEVVLSGDDEGLPSKPAPDVFLEAARRLHVSPAHTLVLEDSAAGIRAAADGGFIPVMVPDLVLPDDGLRRRARACCATLLEVRDLLAAGCLDD